MSAVFDAHLRLLTILPVRTVERRVPIPSSPHQGRPRRELQLQRREFVRDNAHRMTVIQMAAALRVGRKCVYFHAKAIRAERKRRNTRRKCK